MASGWWFWRDQQLYGDWLGLTVAKQALAANYYVRPLTWKEFIAILGPMFRQTFQSSWGFFGWLSLPLAERAFQIILIVHFLAAVGLILSGKDLEGYLRQMLVLGCAWMSLLASFLYYNLETNSSGWHGRFLFPGIAIGAVAFAGGIDGWGRITGKPQMVNWSVMALGLGLVIYALAGYQVFVQVLDQQNRVAAQHDGPPQNGLFPTQVWRPGMVITDTHILTIPPQSDSLLRIMVGLYKLETMERLPVQDADGNDCPDRALLLTAIDRFQ